MKQTIIKHGITGNKHMRFLKGNVLTQMCCKPSVYLLLLFLFCGRQSIAQVGTWTTVTNFSPHYNEGEMVLLTDGRVITKTSGGGSDPSGNTWDVLTPDSHGSYINGTWSSITPMLDSRLYFSTQVLPDGRVYVAGGEYGTGTNKGEVYNPKTNAWASAGSIPGVKFSDANSQLLPSGKVLQASVVDTIAGVPHLSRATFLYDPATNTYAPGPNTLGVDNESVWVKLPDNSVLFCDRNLTSLPEMTSERYIPSTNTWVADATVPVELYDAWGAECGAAFLLPNGKVFFMGGSSSSAIYTPSGTSAPGTWEVGPAIPNGFAAPDAAAAMMANGKILFALSPAPFDASNIFTDPVYFYEYDYITNAFTLVPNMFGVDSVGLEELVYGSYITNMLDLPDGTVMFTFSGYDQYWIYTPTGRPLAAGKPTLSNIIKTGCTTYTMTGKLFNGISEGAAYGDDWQMSSNYPIVRLTSGSDVYYATTSNWNRIGAVMTGSAPDTAQFELPAGLPDGTYSVVVIANGNPSAPKTITTSTHAISPSASTICVGRSVTLTDVVGGGIWKSSDYSKAFVLPFSGYVLGLSPGTVTISDSFGLCVAKATVTVISAPGSITGIHQLCQGATTTLSSSPSGGVWTSSNAHASAGRTTGIVTGVSGGGSTITYSLGGSCYTTTAVSVMAAPAVAISGAACVGSTLTMTCAPAFDSMAWKTGSTYLKSTISPTSPYGVVTMGAVDGLAGPTGTFVTSGGDLYVADFYNGRVLEYPAGSTSSTPGIVVAQNGLAQPYSVFVDASGYIYVGDEGYGGVIWQFPPGSDYTTYGNPMGVVFGGFIGDIAVDADGNVFAADVNNNLVLEFPAGDTYPGSPAIPVIGDGSGAVYGIGLGAGGILYAADYNNNVVYKYNPLGGFGAYDGGTIVAGNNGAGGGANQFYGASGVIVDASGNMYVTDNLNNRVQKFPAGSTGATNGVTVAGMGGAGYGMLQLNGPYHSSVDASGKIYVPDFGNGRVQVYSNVGATSTTTTDSYTPVTGGTYSATVTDIHGCTATATATVQDNPVCSISVTAGPGAYTGGVPTTIYLGYGPTTATFHATATGGSGITYLWSSASGTSNLSNIHIANPVFTATVPGHYTYVLTVTNSNGCKSTCTVSMCVIDAVDHKHKGFVLLCHAYGCAPTTLSLLPIAVALHLPFHSSTDHLGPCGSKCSDAAGKDGEQESPVVMADELKVTAFPNPYTNEVHVKVESNLTDNVDVTVYDVTGRIRDNKVNMDISSDIILGQNLTPGIYFIEVHQGSETRKVKVVKY